MPDGLEARVTAIEKELEHRRQLVNGYMPGPETRKRIEDLEKYVAARAAEVDAKRRTQTVMFTLGGLAIAGLSVLIAILR